MARTGNGDARRKKRNEHHSRSLLFEETRAKYIFLCAQIRFAPTGASGTSAPERRFKLNARESSPCAPLTSSSLVYKHTHTHKCTQNMVCEKSLSPARRTDVCAACICIPEAPTCARACSLTLLTLRNTSAIDIGAGARTSHAVVTSERRNRWHAHSRRSQIQVAPDFSLSSIKCDDNKER